MKIWVTVAAGLIGVLAGLRLLAHGDSVVGLDNLNDCDCDCAYDYDCDDVKLERIRL